MDSINIFKPLTYDFETKLPGLEPLTFLIRCCCKNINDALQSQCPRLRRPPLSWPEVTVASFSGSATSVSGFRRLIDRINFRNRRMTKNLWPKKIGKHFWRFRKKKLWHRRSIKDGGAFRWVAFGQKTFGQVKFHQKTFGHLKKFCQIAFRWKTFGQKTFCQKTVCQNTYFWKTFSQGTYCQMKLCHKTNI